LSVNRSFLARKFRPFCVKQAEARCFILVLSYRVTKLASRRHQLLQVHTGSFSRNPVSSGRPTPLYLWPKWNAAVTQAALKHCVATLFSCTPFHSPLLYRACRSSHGVRQYSIALRSNSSWSYDLFPACPVYAEQRKSATATKVYEGCYPSGGEFETTSAASISNKKPL
jgi:hypothetical protein